MSAIIPLIAILLPFAAVSIMLWRSSRYGVSTKSFPALDPMRMDVAQGSLAILAATERPIEGDRNTEAYCWFTGIISGPDIADTKITNRLVLPMGVPWPEAGHTVPVLYQIDNVEASWQFLPESGYDAGHHFQRVF